MSTFKMGKNDSSNIDLISPNQSFDYHHGDRNSTVLSAAQNYYHNGVQNSTKHKFDSPCSNSSSPVDEISRNSSLRSPRLLFSEDEEEELSFTLKEFYDKDLEELLKISFESKNYNFYVPGAKLTSPDKLFSEEKWPDEKLPELQKIKHNLNSVKSKLNEYELTNWHKHTRSMNPADRVMRHLRRDVKVEFVTQAWCKFYELISKYKLIPIEARKENEFFSFHLCEAPGAFVASLNHYLTLNHPNLKWFWKANSLNPYYEGNNLSEMINDDRFMLQTISNWDFGSDMTGDITDPDYPSYLLDRLKGTLPHLVTADGSFDCQDKPEEQESSVSWLHLKETLIALNILKKGGNFIIKMFTFFECDTVCLLTLLAASFQDIKVDKPATSKEGNSEVYVVCQKFKGRNAIQPCLDRLLAIDLKTYQKCSMLPYATYNKFFLREIIKCAELFATFQINVIERNIRIYNDNPDDPNLRKHCDFLQEKFVQHYIKKYKLKQIHLKDNIVNLPRLKYQIEKKPPLVIENRDRKQGSHNERVQRSSLEAYDLLVKINDELRNDLHHHESVPNYPLYLPRGGCEVPVDAFDIKFGKPITVVQSSQFCHGRFMRIRNEMVKTYGFRRYAIACNATTTTNFMETPEDDFNSYCDFSMLYMKEDNNTAQRQSFRIICCKLRNLSEGDYLKLIGFPLLTQFNINVLCVLRQIFKTVLFNAPNTLILTQMEQDRLELWRNKLLEIENSYTSASNRAVISFLPVDFITGANDFKFYEWLVKTNNCRLCHEISRVIDMRPPSLSDRQRD